MQLSLSSSFIGCSCSYIIDSLLLLKCKYLVPVFSWIHTTQDLNIMNMNFGTCGECRTKVNTENTSPLAPRPQSRTHSQVLVNLSCILSLDSLSDVVLTGWWGIRAALQQWPVVETVQQPLCFQAESRWLGSRGSVAGFQQPIGGCGCVRPGRATSPGAGRKCV